MVEDNVHGVLRTIGTSPSSASSAFAFRSEFGEEKCLEWHLKRGQFTVDALSPLIIKDNSCGFVGRRLAAGQCLSLHGRTSGHQFLDLWMTVNADKRDADNGSAPILINKI